MKLNFYIFMVTILVVSYSSLFSMKSDKQTCSFLSCLSRSKQTPEELAHKKAKLIQRALKSLELEVDDKLEALADITKQIKALTLEGTDTETKTPHGTHIIFDDISHTALHKQVEIAIAPKADSKGVKPAAEITEIEEKLTGLVSPYTNINSEAQQQLIQTLECVFSLVRQHGLEKIIAPETLALMINTSFKKATRDLFTLTENYKACNETILAIWHCIHRRGAPKSFDFFALGIHNYVVLLKSGIARIDAEDAVGNTPLHHAAEQLRATIESGAPEKALLNDLAILQTLIRTGADANARNRAGMTPRDILAQATI